MQGFPCEVPLGSFHFVAELMQHFQQKTRPRSGRHPPRSARCWPTRCAIRSTSRRRAPFLQTSVLRSPPPALEALIHLPQIASCACRCWAGSRPEQAQPFLPATERLAPRDVHRRARSNPRPPQQAQLHCRRGPCRKGGRTDGTERPVSAGHLADSQTTQVLIVGKNDQTGPIYRHSRLLRRDVPIEAGAVVRDEAAHRGEGEGAPADCHAPPRAGACENGRISSVRPRIHACRVEKSRRR